MDSSWFSTAIASASKLQDSFVSKMPASMIPPPITQSVYMPSIRRPSASSPPSAPLRDPKRPWYQRKQRTLESELQVLLDAQAEGLASGPDNSDGYSDSGRQASSTRSSTPTLYSTQDIVPRRNGKVTLRDARKGLYMTMRRLALLKQEEIRDADDRLDAALASYDKTQTWSTRRVKLVKRLEEIQDGSDSKLANSLREQAKELQPDIDELERQLSSLRIEQKRLQKEAADVENRVDAKMSSYTRNLEALDKDVKEFLRTMQPSGDASTMFSRNSGDEEPFWSLAPNRRTLDLATAVLEKEKQDCEGKQEQIETEREALEEGAVVWKDAVKDVEGFEKALRDEMKKLATTSTHRSSRPASPEQRLEALLAEMQQVTSQLESKLKLAESRGWKLLIAAIGAELDAFRKGRTVLEDALAATRGDNDLIDDHQDPPTEYDSVIHSPPTRVQLDHGRSIHDLDRAFESKRPLVMHDTDDDDDGPDPELLISHHDTDEE